MMIIVIVVLYLSNNLFTIRFHGPLGCLWFSAIVLYSDDISPSNLAIDDNDDDNNLIGYL